VAAICTTRCNIRNSEFGPHNVFLCFAAEYSKHTATVSYAAVKHLCLQRSFFCVHSAVKTQFLTTGNVAQRNTVRSRNVYTSSLT